MNVRLLILLVLSILVFVSAISVVYVTHHQRRLFISLQQLQQQRDQMNIEWRKLLLEENSISTTSRVQQKATDELDMKIPATTDIIFIRLD